MVGSAQPRGALRIPIELGTRRLILCVGGQPHTTRVPGVIEELRQGLLNRDPRSTAALHRIEAVLRRAFPRPDHSAYGAALADGLIRDLERELAMGRLCFHEMERVVLDDPEPGIMLAELRLIAPERPEAPRPQPDRWFELRIVDEVGEPIPGVAIATTQAGGLEVATTLDDGSARFEHDGPSVMNVRVASVAALHEAVRPRWVLYRAPQPPQGDDITQVRINGELAPLPLRSNTPHTLVVHPPPIFDVRVVDELGEPVEGVELILEVEGAASTAFTDANGDIRIDDLDAGVARLHLADPGAVRDSLRPRWDQPRKGDYVEEGPGVSVARLGREAPPLIRSAERHTLSIQPRVVSARLHGALFDTNKSFLLPSAIPGLRQIESIYDDNRPSELLVVGHTDRSGEAWVNDPLSLERAKSMAAYLTDDVDVWLRRYRDNVSAKRRWGKHEDLLMISALLMNASPTPVLDKQSVCRFQSLHNTLPSARRGPNWAPLAEDGSLGPATRRQLITDYMHQDGTTLPSDVVLTGHGCGENFPLDESGEALDPDAEDGEHDDLDRRVELFFFDHDLGVQPPPRRKNSKKGSKEYPEWRRRAQETHEFEARAHGPLELTTWAPPGVEVGLCIDDPNGERVATLGREHAEVDGDVLTFSVLPEMLPPEVEFVVTHDGEPDHSTGVVDPVALRDALHDGDVDAAEARSEEHFEVIATAAPVAPPATKKSTSKTPFRVRLRWPNGRHRFLRKMDVVLRVQNGKQRGPLKPVGGKPSTGYRSFDVPDHATHLALEMTIDHGILNITQNFEVVRSSSGKAELKATSWSPPPSGPQHPRLRVLGLKARKRGSSLIDVKVDLEFLDLTNYLKAPNTNFRRLADRAQAWGIKSTIRVLEHTRTIKGRNTVWPVILPRTIKAKRRQGALLFFKNEALDHIVNGNVTKGAYTNADDANYTRAIVPYWADPDVIGKYVLGSPPQYNRLTQFGWDKQLRRAKKSLAVLFPIPHATSFGALDAPSPKSRRLIDAAFRCLYADGHLKSGHNSKPPRVGHLAAGGWSSGTDTLFRWARASTSKKSGFVDELWVFDGKKGFKANLASWYATDKRRRLRLIGTAYTEQASNQLIKHYGKDANVFVVPGDPKYWYRNPEYKQSLAAPNQQPLRFRLAGTPGPSSDASGRTNIFVKRETIVNHGTSVDQKLVLTAPGLNASYTIPLCSNEEAATFIVLEKLAVVTGGGPVTTKAQFDQLARWAHQQPKWSEPHHAYRHRHGWSVMGGTFPGGRFRGYFQQCLDESGFARGA